MFDHFFPRAVSGLVVFCTPVAGESAKRFLERASEEMVDFLQGEELASAEPHRNGGTTFVTRSGRRAYFRA